MKSDLSPMPRSIIAAIIAISCADSRGQTVERQTDGIPKRLLATLKGASGTRVAFSADGKRLFTAGEREVRLWDAGSFLPVTDPFDHGAKLRTAVLGPDAKQILTISAMEARLWDVKTGKHLVLPQKTYVFDGAFSPDGKQVVTAGDEAKVWDTATGRLVRQLEHDTFTSFVAFSSKGDRLLTICSGKANGAAFLWDTSNGKRLLGPLTSAVVPARWDRERPIGAAAWSPDGTKVATIDVQAFNIWDTKTGRNLLIAQGPKGQDDAINSLAFSPDSRKIVVADVGYVNIYDAATGEMLVEFEPLACKHGCFTADGKRIVVSQMMGASLWDAKTGKEILSIEGADQKGLHRDDSGSLAAVAVSPDGTLLAVGWPKSNVTMIWALPK